MDQYGDGYIGFGGSSTASYGNFVKIQHSDGTYTLYAHMLKGTIRVSVGDTVEQGQVIGQMGTSGNSSGVHLHFEVRDANNNRLNPLNYINADNPRPVESTGGTSGGTVDSSSVQGRIWNFLISHGVNEIGAAAIMGNIQQESSFNPNSVNSIGAVGICQWLDSSRKNPLQEFATSQGKSYTDLDVQLEFMWMEMCPNVPKTHGASQILTTSEFNSIVNATDLRTATDIFMREFEVCGNYESEIVKRFNYAQNWYNTYAGK